MIGIHPRRFHELDLRFIICKMLVGEYFPGSTSGENKSQHQNGDNYKATFTSYLFFEQG